MEFNEVEELLLEHFALVHEAYGRAFETDFDADKLWSVYLESIPARINPIFRKRREYDCSCCRQFLKSIGGIVFVDSQLNIHTLWEEKIDDPDFQIVFEALDSFVRSH